MTKLLSVETDYFKAPKGLLRPPAAGGAALSALTGLVAGVLAAEATTGAGAVTTERGADAMRRRARAGWASGAEAAANGGTRMGSPKASRISLATLSASV